MAAFETNPKYFLGKQTIVTIDGEEYYLERGNEWQQAVIALLKKIEENTRKV